MIDVISEARLNVPETARVFMREYGLIPELAMDYAELWEATGDDEMCYEIIRIMEMP